MLAFVLAAASYRRRKETSTKTAQDEFKAIRSASEELEEIIGVARLSLPLRKQQLQSNAATLSPRSVPVQKGTFVSLMVQIRIVLCLNVPVWR